MNKNKLFAPFLTLLISAIVLMAMLYWKYKLNKIAVVLLIVVLVSYIVGINVQNKVNKFIEANEEEAQKQLEESEGAVIEKDALKQGDDSSFDGEESGSLPPLTGAMPNNESEDEFGEFRTREE